MITHQVVIPKCYKAPKISVKLMGGTDYLLWAQEAEASWIMNGVWKYFDDKDDMSKLPCQYDGAEGLEGNEQSTCCHSDAPD